LINLKNERPILKMDKPIDCDNILSTTYLNKDILKIVFSYLIDDLQSYIWIKDGIYIMKILLKCGADPNQKDEHGRTTLSWSVYKYNSVYENTSEMIKLLLKYGANVNLKCGNRYQTILMHTSEPYVMELLLKKGANPNINGGIAKETHIMYYLYTQRASHYRVIELLLKYGADPNGKDDYGRSNLEYVLKRISYNIAGLLLKYGADINAQDKYGKTCLMNLFYNESTIIFLVEHGANLNIQDKTGKTALMLNPDSVNVGLLLKYGADPNIQDYEGNTALMLSNDKKRFIKTQSVSGLVED